MHPRDLGIDFPLDRLALIERCFRPSAEILLLQLPHEGYFVEELPVSYTHLTLPTSDLV